MDVKVTKRLEKHLNSEQLKNYINYSTCFMVYFRSKSPEDLAKYKHAEERLLESTGGKLPCEIIPLTVWG